MIRITDIIDTVLSHNPNADVDIINRAYLFSAKVHEGQTRLSGEPYLSHPVAVANILANMYLDTESIVAALLHDVMEDTQATEQEIEELFGSVVLHLIQGVTKLSILPFSDLQVRQAESLRKMILAMANDIRVILIKLADRLHNMRTLHFHRSEEKKQQIARETIDIYAPIAARLGMYRLKQEIEDLSFAILSPEELAQLQEWVAVGQEDREKYIETVKKLLSEKMAAENIPCEVLGRYKNFYSIHRKMTTQNLKFQEVYDLIAFRIIVDTTSQCYEALGHIHSLWKPLSYKFKDYIAMPKPNMYQSLHTTVIGSFGERLEIQIRTHEMDIIAKSGIAAHWGYKERASVDEQTSKTFAWLQSLVENQENVNSPEELLENVKIDLFSDEVYVFTPKGEIKTLPRGATPIDFAFLVHTEVGMHCAGAKVNGRMVPLRHVLENGDIVEVVTVKTARPSKDWLNSTVTVKARSRVRQWIKAQENERSFALGKEMCEKAFRKHKLSFNVSLKTDRAKEIPEMFGLKNMDEVIISIGYGKITPFQLVQKFTTSLEDDRSENSFFGKIFNRVLKKKASDTGVTVQGLDDILVRFGKCCQPVQGDSIVGHITRGAGITIHRRSCVNAMKVSPDRQIEVQWNKDPDQKTSYPVKIRVISKDRVGLLADIAASFSKATANIVSLHTETKEDLSVESYFTVMVENTSHLQEIIQTVKKVPSIQDVHRVTT